VKRRPAKTLFIQSSLGSDVIGSQGTHAERRLLIPRLTHRIGTVQDLRNLGFSLTNAARYYWSLKDINALELASKLLIEIPLGDEFFGPAHFYKALCDFQRGEIHSARTGLERVLAKGSRHYSARALQILGITFHYRGDLDQALSFYLEASRAAAPDDFAIQVEARRTIAVVRSIQGDHRRALQELESLFPFARALSIHSPVLYCEYVNSLAVELGEAGRLDEAEAAAAFALGSPYASVFPEFAETRNEIARKRKVVARVPLLRRSFRNKRTASKNRHSVQKKPTYTPTTELHSGGIVRMSPAIIPYILVWIRRAIGSRSPPNTFQKLTATRFTNISRNVGRQSR